MPGFGWNQDVWRFVWPAFAADHRIVLADLVGAHGSDLTAYDPERHASLDGYVDDLLEVGQYLHRRIADSELVVMQATGHCPHLSAPDEVVAAIGAFLGRRPARPVRQPTPA